MKPGPVGRLGAGRMQSSNTEDRGPHRERASPGPTLVTHTPVIQKGKCQDSRKRYQCGLTLELQSHSDK